MISDAKNNVCKEKYLEKNFLMINLSVLLFGQKAIISFSNCEMFQVFWINERQFIIQIKPTYCSNYFPMFFILDLLNLSYQTLFLYT